MTSSPKPVDVRERRRSFLDVGGPNSISNFATSYVRTQSYLSHCLGDESLDDAISPGTSPIFQSTTGSSSSGASAGEPNPLFLDRGAEAAYAPFPQESYPDYGSSERGFDHIKSYQFPRSNSGDVESNALLPVSSHRSASFSSQKFEGSTAPQTIFNAINTMMGIGMLSLPLGFKLSGWVFGSIMLLFSAVSTNITAKMLGDILRRYPHLMSYSDIAQLSFGSSINVIVTLIFSIDLMGATASLILLFGDSFAILFPSIHITIFKTTIVVLTFISSFLPLSILSMSSLLGIVCTTGIVVIIIICGLKANDTLEGLGSLLHPAPTYMWPQNASNLLVALGIFMAPWGGHVVFPELYRDMRHPSKYNSCTNITFNFTFFVDYLIGAVGFLMFGVECFDSFTKNLMLQPNYPTWVKPFICLLMGVLALVKAPLLIRPVLTVVEKALSIETITIGSDGAKKEAVTIARILIRFFYLAFLLFISITFTSFGGLIAFLGSSVCFSICLVLPLIFYLRIFRDELSMGYKIVIYAAAFVGAVCAIAGTYGSISIDV